MNEAQPESAIRGDAEDSELQRLDPRVVGVWRLTALGATVVTLAGALLLERWIGRWLPSGLLLAFPVVLGVAFALLWPPAHYESWGFQMRAADLLVRRGVLWRTTSVIPYARIQHVDVRHSPLERMLGLARLVVFTAGIRGAELTVPGVPAEEADVLRDRLAALGGMGDAL